MEQQIDYSQEDREPHCPRCILDGTALSAQARAKICLHNRLDPVRFAEFFWDET